MDYNKIIGIKILIPKTLNPSLYNMNFNINDICLSKLVIPINGIILNNFCVPYKSLQIGNLIYLFDIHNINIKNKILNFEIYAFSFCPIDNEKSLIYFLINIKQYVL